MLTDRYWHLVASEKIEMNSSNTSIQYQNNAFTGLNKAQVEAVETLEGPLLMLAGAGTGKTRALTSRIAHLIATDTAKPNQILAVTFTNKAAREMRERVDSMLNASISGLPWLGTFHAICAKLLRRHAELIAVEETESSKPNIHLKSDFTILDTLDQIRLLRQVLAEKRIDPQLLSAKELLRHIDNWKNRAVLPAAVSESDVAGLPEEVTACYAAYQQRLIELNAVDFGDLLLHMVKIFQTQPRILQKYQHWFRYILVDEYQDTNVVQYMWLRLLAAKHKNICCVGDDDQSIYGWRGARLENILNFEANFPGCHVVRLEQNYRSTPHILAAAAAVIRQNKNRLGKELWTSEEFGEKVRLVAHYDGSEEAYWTAENIAMLHLGASGMPPFALKDIAILVRTTYQMRAFEDAFLQHQLAYRVVGGLRFFERAEIRDAIAYLRLALSATDDLAFERIVNTPKRGIGDVRKQKIEQCARSNHVSLFEGTRIVIETGEIKGKEAKALNSLLQMISKWNELVRENRETSVELTQRILDESGYVQMWKNDLTPEAPGRVENLEELVNSVGEFQFLQDFLDHVSLVIDNDSDREEDKVTIMTLHAAKGLEFPVVFLPGWEEDLFPLQRVAKESGTLGIEEERRLAYVGVTRAEKICTISYADNRLKFGEWEARIPSRFINDLPDANIKVVSESNAVDYDQDETSWDSQLEVQAASANVYNSPGWRRLASRGGVNDMAPPLKKNKSRMIADDSSQFAVGQRIFHQKFGYGSIFAIDGDKVEVNFEKSGQKKLLASFVYDLDNIPI